MTMTDPTHPIARLLRKDQRYKFDAYVFVFEALNYAHEVLKLGSNQSADESGQSAPVERAEKRPERHLSGQELCEAIRRYALEQYGYLAKNVLNSWGVHHTRDFGNIVFNLIEIKQMKKTSNDRREDFDDVFDFEEGLVREFRITHPQKGNA